MTLKKLNKCGVDEVCPTLDKAISQNASRVGLYARPNVDVATGDELHTLMIRSSSTAKEYVLQYCPFCGQDLSGYHNVSYVNGKTVVKGHLVSKAEMD